MSPPCRPLLTAPCEPCPRSLSHRFPSALSPPSQRRLTACLRLAGSLEGMNRGGRHRRRGNARDRKERLQLNDFRHLSAVRDGAQIDRMIERAAYEIRRV